MLSDTDTEEVQPSSSVRLLEVERKGGISCGFHLTKVKWDPYPWVSAVDTGSVAQLAGMKDGDCLLEVNGEDIVGRRISEVADLVKSRDDQVSLLLWNAGVDLKCSPEALCCGPMPTNFQRLSACMSCILGALECPVCLDTIPPPAHQCDNGHLICIRCRSKSERCPVCRMRLARGRSLFADQVYNCFTEAFNLREEPEEIRKEQLQRLFRLKSKKKAAAAVPDIKVTPSHANKFLARIIGKASSAENLSGGNKLSASPNRLLSVGDDFLNSNLKTKSSSTSELFNSSSQNNGSIKSSGIMDRRFFSSGPQRPISYHSSIESIDGKIAYFEKPTAVEDNTLYNCPYGPTCSDLIKGSRLIKHFQEVHDGPLVQYFKPKILIALSKIDTNHCAVISFEENTFYLRILQDYFLNNENKLRENNEACKDTLIWTWLMGNKNDCSNYQLQVNAQNADTGVTMSRSAIYSLSSVSYQDVLQSRRGVFLSAETLSIAKNLNNNDVVIQIEIVKISSSFES